MADDPQRNDPSDEPVTTSPVKEDAQTTATRRELKQTSISEKAAGEQPRPSSQESSNGSDVDEAEKKETKAPARTKTPDLKMTDVPAIPPSDLKETVSSPKKKRAHDQVDEQKDAQDTLASSTELNGSTALSRTDRSEPEKKRARDEHSGDEVWLSKTFMLYTSTQLTVTGFTPN
jgi:Ran-binding protein 3